MARSHVRYTVTDRAGNAIQNATATFYVTGTSTLVNDIYTAASGGSPVASAAFLSNGQGEVEAWMETPKTIDVQVSDTADTAYYSGLTGSLLTFSPFTETIEVAPPPENVGLLDGSQSWTGTNTFSGIADIATARLKTHPWADVTHPAYGATGDGVTDDRAAIAAADLAGAPVRFPVGTYAVASNLTISSHCIFDKGAVLLPAAGVTITFSDTFTAGDYKVFDLSNSAAAIVATKIGDWWARWFGAKGDNTGDDGVPINQAAATAIGSGRNANVRLGAGRFRHTTTITYGSANHGVSLIGLPGMAFRQGSQLPACTLSWAGGASPQVQASGFWNVEGVAFENFGSATTAFYAPNGAHGRLKNVHTVVPSGATAWSESAFVIWDFEYSHIQEWENTSAPALKYGVSGTIFHLSDAQHDPASASSNLAWQAVSINATGGTFTLTYGGQTTAAIAWNASAAVVQDALESLSNLCRGAVSVVGGYDPVNSGLYPYYVTFGARVDTGCTLTSGSASVTDASITATSAGLFVTGDGVPPNTYAQTVTAGVGFKLSSSRASQVDVTATKSTTTNLAIKGAGLGAVAVTAITADATGLSGGASTATVRNATPLIVSVGTADGLTVGPRFTFDAYANCNCLYDNSHVAEFWQAITTGTSSAGTFTVTYKGQTTGGIAYNASAATVSTAVNALSTVTADGGVMVRGGDLPSHVFITFNGSVSGIGVYPAFTVSSAGLTGGTASVTQPTSIEVGSFNLQEAEIDNNAGSSAVLSLIRATNVRVVDLRRLNASGLSSLTDGVCLLTESVGTSYGNSGTGLAKSFFRTASRNALADPDMNRFTAASTFGAFDPTGQVGSSIEYIEAAPNRDVNGQIKVRLDRGKHGSIHYANVTDSSAYTVLLSHRTDAQNPGNLVAGRVFGVMIYNNSGGAHGTITFSTSTNQFDTLAFPFPAVANGRHFTIWFVYDGRLGKAVEIHRSLSPVAQPSAFTQTYSTASKTHANLTSADLSGITSSTTGSALAEPSAAYTQSEMQQNFRRLQDQYNALKADLTNLKQVVNSVIDDLQSEGWLA